MKTTYVQYPLDAKKRGRNKLHRTAIQRRRQFIKSAMIEFFWGGRTWQRVIN